MREDNTPTVTKRTRTPSRKLRLRLETAKALKALNQKAKTVRQKKKEAKANAKQPDPEHHISLSRVPRLKKNRQAEPPRPTSKYQRRQVNKTWLPTHLWHTKRAHMTCPTEPLWRMAIPLSPAEKSYRPTHRAAASRGCIAWDMTYISTISCWGTETALDHMLRALAFTGTTFSSAQARKWKAGTRFSEGWVFERDHDQRAIAPVTVVWLVKPAQREPPSHAGASSKEQAAHQHGRRKPKLDRQILLQIHPSAFHQFWHELLKVAKMQKPQVLVEDLRFEIGSVEVQGPGSTEALLGVLRPLNADHPSGESAERVWMSLAGLNNPASLPWNSLLAFDITDPRLRHPPKRIEWPDKDEDREKLNEILVSWPPDHTLGASSLASHKARWLVSNALPSQKAINRRRALAPPGRDARASDNDPPIPVILLARRSEVEASSMAGNSQGRWTVLLPWTCVDPVWRSLMYYPLSSGGTPRFGGLNQKQQLAFEQMIPWFPGDMPGTESGKAWERIESEKRFDEWVRRPPSRRIAWDRVDLGLGRKGEIGRGWTCDWEFLLESTAASSRDAISSDGPSSHRQSLTGADKRPVTRRQRKAAKAETEAQKAAGGRRRRNSSSVDSDEEDDPGTVDSESTVVKYSQLPPHLAMPLFKDCSPERLPPIPALVTVRITLLIRGTPNPAARIYRLPTANQSESQIVPPIAIPAAALSDRSSFTPPPAQPSPARTTEQPATSSASSDLRAQWLSLDPVLSSVSASASSPVPNSQPAPKLQKQKLNHRNLPRHQHSLPLESLSHINVLPTNAPKEVIEKYAAEPPSAPLTTSKQIPHPDQDRVHTVTAAEKRQNLLSALISANIDESPNEWAKHVPCPDAGDLIGFVTSGGYNLHEGRGTAIGSIWAQRVLEGWKEEDGGEAAGSQEDANAVDSAAGMAAAGRQLESREKAKDSAVQRRRNRERHLCIVRNAGESVGRLGIWEIC